MKPVTDAQAAWLRVVHHLTVSLRRPPVVIELAEATGSKRSGTKQRIHRAVDDGHLVRGPKGPSTTPSSLRVTPQALVHIGVPLVAYLAWPFGSTERGQVIAQWLARWRVYAISPCLVEHGLLAPDIASSMAMRADCVVVYTDPLLVGREDVQAAIACGIPVTVIRPADERSIESAADLWKPPLLLPAP